MEKKITERHVQAIWYDCELRPLHLVTGDGRPVRVVHPGDWNSASGPDFKGAVLEVGAERRRIVGDVEVHIAPSDWEAHGHGRDLAYQNVIAHVTWRDGSVPRSLPKTAVSIWLGRFFEKDIGFSLDAIDTQAYPFCKVPAPAHPCRKTLGQDRERARRVLATVGRWRIHAKAERLRQLLQHGDPCQVFYAEIMAALGYGKNANAFRAIASAVPYDVVRDEPEHAASAMLLAASFVNLNRDGTRPSNAPDVRLAAAARLFSETDVMQLADQGDFSPNACRHMISVLTRGRYIGRGRAAAIVANVIVPFALARRRVRTVPSWLPPEDVSAPARGVALRMLGGEHNPRAWYAANGVLIQGLIQIDRAWCARLRPDCIGCRAAA